MNTGRLQGILSAFPGKTILIVGDVMLDEYIWGETRHISPEAPVPVVEIKQRTYAPGGAANAAVNAASMGGRVFLGGVLGLDHQASQLSDLLKQCGVDVSGLITDEGRPTTTKTRIVAHSQHVVRVDSETKNPIPTHVEIQLLQWAERHLPTAHACVISDYVKGVVSSRLAKKFIKMACEANCPVVVDPKDRDFTKYQGATIITPNLNEAEQACGIFIQDELSLIDAGHKLLCILDGSALLITRGAQGMSLFMQGQASIHVPTEAREVFDVTGAGDTALVTLALALAAGAHMEEAVHLANKAAGIVVGKVGTATVLWEELRDSIY